MKRRPSFLIRLTEAARRLNGLVYTAEILLYYPAFFLLHSQIGTTAIVLSLIPAITFAALISKWAGFIVGFGLLIPNYFILDQLHSMGPNTIDFVGLVVAHITVGGLGYVYGDLYTVRLSLARELAERKASEAKFRGLFDRSQDAVLISDMEMKITDINEGALRMLGYSSSELIGQSYTKIVAPEELSDLEGRIEHALTGVELPIYERNYIRKDGQRIIVEVSGALILNAEGVPSHFQTISRDISIRKATEKELYYKATHDDLTGLFNRAMFIELINRGLERCRRDKKQMALFFIDLDKFKAVNDSHGHLVGDMALRECANRLTNLLRKSDAIARVGGDEFTVMVEPIEEKKYAQKVAKTIEASLGAPFKIEDKDIDVSASVGISYFPGDGDDPEALLGKADQLMYGIKHDKRRLR